MIRVPMVILMFAAWAVGLADQKPQPAPAKNPELQDQLLRRAKQDQEARNALTKWIAENGKDGAVVTTSLSKEKKAEFERLIAKGTEVDKQNTKWLKGMIDKQGWPTVTLVGKDGADAAFLLVQHADADPKFQRRCLNLMAKLPKDEVSRSNYAYLTDRVLLAEGKKQIYGTQFTLVKGKWKPRPIQDEANVDKRRAEAGLPPLAEYAKVIEQQYQAAPRK